MRCSQQAGGCPAATHFLLLRQKKVSKEKATLLSASPSLRYGATCGARSSRGLARTRLRLRQSRALIRLALRSSAQTEGWWGRGRGRIQIGFGFAIGLRRRRAKRVFASPPPHWISSAPPVGPGRGAQPESDQGERLSERSEFERDPALTEHRRLPAAKRRVADSRVAFFFAYFLFGDAKRK